MWCRSVAAGMAGGSLTRFDCTKIMETSLLILKLYLLHNYPYFTDLYQQVRYDWCGEEVKFGGSGGSSVIDGSINRSMWLWRPVESVSKMWAYSAHSLLIDHPLNADFCTHISSIETASLNLSVRGSFDLHPSDFLAIAGATSTSSS